MAMQQLDWLLLGWVLLQRIVLGVISDLCDVIPKKAVWRAGGMKKGVQGNDEDLQSRHQVSAKKFAML